jgi:hypothetical protein
LRSSLAASVPSQAAFAPNSFTFAMTVRQVGALISPRRLSCSAADVIGVDGESRRPRRLLGIPLLLSAAEKESAALVDRWLGLKT